ncbi:uncharacterized protein LOC116167192 isoform X1 [Photinus pyralis]|uniref:uncharacterized protein LOC116167192 isoform X1 n=1 Tax=Photinus pyralis TaxID=7054 RepID=UPI00126719DC|nr:uncharacterized protein LOC116167192 isoform X1 [Photinus pyralis]
MVGLVTYLTYNLYMTSPRFFHFPANCNSLAVNQLFTLLSQIQDKSNLKYNSLAFFFVSTSFPHVSRVYYYKMNRTNDIQKYYMRAKRQKVSTSRCTLSSHQKEDSLINIDEMVMDHLDQAVSDYDDVAALPVSQNFSLSDSTFITDKIANVQNLCDNNITPKLKNWSLQHNITHGAINDLLRLLKTTQIPDNLPLDARTLLGTARTIHTKLIEPGEYYHFGLRSCLKRLVNISGDVTDKLSVLEININIDGLPLSKSSNSQVYPILCNIVGCNSVEMPNLWMMLLILLTMVS